MFIDLSKAYLMQKVDMGERYILLLFVFLIFMESLEKGAGIKRYLYLL